MMKQFFTSKKFVVFVVTVIVAAAVMFGIPEESALTFVDKLVQLAMVYMGSQGVADVGKYAGEAIADMKAKREAELAKHNEIKPAEDGGTADG